IRDFHVTGVQTCALPISVATLARYDLNGRFVQKHETLKGRMNRGGPRGPFFGALGRSRTPGGLPRTRGRLATAFTPESPPSSLQIGRASCRERVYISVGS